MILHLYSYGNRNGRDLPLSVNYAVLCPEHAQTFLHPSYDSVLLKRPALPGETECQVCRALERLASRPQARQLALPLGGAM